MQGALGMGPIGSQDNGDGTFTFEMPDGSRLRGSGPEAAAKHQEINGGAAPMQASPELASLAQKPPDMRTAAADQGSFSVPGLSLDASGNLARGAPPPVASDAGGLPPPPDPQTSAILRNLNAQAGIPQTVKPKPGAHGSGHVDPDQLVGAGTGGGPSNGQIPTVVTGGGGGPSRPGSLQLAQRSTAQAVVPQAVQNEFTAANTEKGKALEQETAADRTAAENIASIKDQVATGLGTNRQNVDEAEARRQNYLLMRQQRIDEANAKLQGFKDEKAPEIGIGGAIAMALGEAGASLRGSGVNSAMMLVNKRLDMAIDAHRKNFEKAKGNVQAEKEGYAGVVNLFGDQRQAELAYRNRYLDDASAKLDAATANVQSPLIKARATAMKAALMEEKAKNDAKFQTIEEHNSYVMTKPTAGGGAVPIHADVKKNETVRGPDGKLYEFGEGATAQKAGERLAAINQSSSDAAELQSIVGNPANLADPAKRSQAAAIAARIIKSDKEAEGGQNHFRSKEGLELAQQAMGGDPNALLNFGKSAGLNEFRNGLRQEGAGIIQQHAISRVEEYQEVDPRTGQATLRYVRKGRAPQRAPDLSDRREGE